VDNAMKCIISTLEADTRYTGIEHSVLIKGRSGGGMVWGIYRPTAASTEVSDDDAAFLASHGIFKLHQKRGFVEIMNTAQVS
jgi:hypothetical protein